MSDLAGALAEFLRAFELQALPAPREVVLEDAAFDRLYADCAGHARYPTDASPRSRADYVDRFRVLGVEVVRHRSQR